MRFLYRLLYLASFFIFPIYAALALILFFLYGACGVINLIFVYLFTGKMYEISDIFSKMIGAYTNVMFYCKEKSKC